MVWPGAPGPVGLMLSPPRRFGPECEYLCAARYFCGEHTRTGLIFTPSQKAPEERRPIGHRNCIETPSFP